MSSLHVVKVEIKIYASKRISTHCATVIDPNDQCNLGHTYKTLGSPMGNHTTRIALMNKGFR